MTYNELTKIPQLAIVEYSGNSVHLHAQEGYYLTKHTDEDYLNYNDFFCTFMPISKDDKYPDYQVITKEQHTENLAKKAQALELKRQMEIEEMENKRKEIEKEEYDIE